MGKIIDYIPGVLIVPFWVLGLLYAVLLPDTIYYAFGIYFDMWFPILETFWGYVIVGLLFAVPLLNIGLFFLLLLQSFIVLAKFIFGSYDPSFHGFITMYPACMTIVVLVLTLLDKD